MSMEDDRDVTHIPSSPSPASIVRTTIPSGKLPRKMSLNRCPRQSPILKQRKTRPWSCCVKVQETMGFVGICLEERRTSTSVSLQRNYRALSRMSVVHTSVPQCQKWVFGVRQLFESCRMGFDQHVCVYHSPRWI
jgi:hypothetical protein